jgi:hypothetical protein
MLNTIAQAHGLLSAKDLQDALAAFEHDLDAALDPLVLQLSRNIITGAPGDISQHMGYVETWRDRVTRFLMVVSACVEHAKSDHFELTAITTEKGGTKYAPEDKREAYRRRLAGGWVALKARLENLIDSIDSRVNLCKKVLGIDADVAAWHRRAA